MRISAENLGKRFNREWIFKNLTLTFESGTTYAVTGPNGSGKSTLLRILWGQMPPSTGTLRYYTGDKKIDTEDFYKHLAIVTPQMELVDEFTLEEMVAFHFKFKERVPTIGAAQILEKMELSDARDKRISNFSSGMKQRLKLALAFFTRAEILFLDEPATNLDSASLDWYRFHLSAVSDRLIFIASNQEQEYPQNASKINMLTFKTGLQTASGRH